MKFHKYFVFQFNQYLSDFGGTLGLWIGASVLTVLEIFDLSFRLFTMRVCRRKTEEQEQRQKHHHKQRSSQQYHNGGYEYPHAAKRNAYNGHRF